MKIVASPKPPTHEEAPVVEATPIPVRRGEGPRAITAPARTPVSSSEAAAISFLRHLRVLTGAARLYQRNHPRLMELLTTAEQQLRVALGAHSPLVFAVERNGIILPRPNAPTGELLSDQRGELRALAEELRQQGWASFLETSN